jgi:coniferyl-aldehyde dehydrogenase
MNAVQTQAMLDPASRMSIQLERMKAAQLREGPPDAGVREDRLNQAIALLVDNERALVEALDADFGGRSHDQSRLTDIAGSIGPLKHAKAHMRRWMRPQRRRTEAPFGLLGARADLTFVPKGVVGVIAPWNFPVNLTFAPLAGVLAAGNRAMIKPSEFTPATSQLMADLFPRYFADDVISVHPGGPDVGSAFAGLAFDHLIFTGGTGIGAKVMQAAARNLVPVTLELGGKSPTIIGRSADLALAARRIATGKTMNAGQICLAPDYVLVPNDLRDAFVTAYVEALRAMYPRFAGNPDYTAIVSDRHHQRLTQYIEDARTQGARVIEVAPTEASAETANDRRMAPVVLTDVSESMTVMQDEIFGPVLPVVGYDTIDEAIDFVNARPRPLGLYWFGKDRAEEERVLQRTVSGGVTINDVIFHVSMEDLPFGGVGPSGMGAYHGQDGFLEFSHRRAVYRQTGVDAVFGMLRPPYGEGFRKFVAGRISR